MSENRFKPRLRQDGSFDPECLEESGLHAVKHWLRRRFSGLDPYFPIDKRYDEDPSSLVVSILRDAGIAHPGALVISRAFMDLLAEAGAMAPAIPKYLLPLLSVCQQVRLPQTNPWFTEELAALARDPEAAELRWGGFETAKEIVYASIMQAPGLPHSPSHESWLSLLKIPRYTTLALLGLGQSFPSRLPHIEEWWRRCPEPTRQQELNHLIFMGLETEGEERVRAILGPVSQSWPDDLKLSVDTALERSGAPKLFAPPCVAPRAEGLAMEVQPLVSEQELDLAETFLQELQELQERFEEIRIQAESSSRHTLDVLKRARLRRAG